MLVRRLATLAVVGGLLVVGGAGPALAHDCFNPNKKAGSGGTVGTVVIDENGGESFVPSGNKGNPAFVEIALPDDTSVFVFTHSAGPNHDGVVPGAKGCDGKGLDLFDDCE